jgi:hypothetical protein
VQGTCRGCIALPPMMRIFLPTRQYTKSAACAHTRSHSFNLYRIRLPLRYATPAFDNAVVSS